MTRAIYPGSFDPVTLGHLDIIRRASKTVSELIVGVLNNGGKTPLFTIEERVEMLKEVTKDLPNVKVMSFSGLLVDFAKHTDSNLVVRGLRAISDSSCRYYVSGNQSGICIFKLHNSKRGCFL